MDDKTKQIAAAASDIIAAAPVPGLKLGFFLLQEAIEYEPAIAAEIQSLFSKGVPTEDEWAALHARIAGKTYRDYVPDSALPPSETSV